MVVTNGRRLAGWTAAALLPVAAACATGSVGMSSLGPAQQADVAAHAQVSAVDAGEIQQAQLAQSRAASGAVRDFARQMIGDHSGALALREQRMQQIGLGLRISARIAAGEIGWAGPNTGVNGQGVVSNSSQGGGVGTTGTGLGAVSTGQNEGNRDASANGSGVVSSSTTGGGNGTTGTGMGEVSAGSGSAGASGSMDATGTGAFTAQAVLSPGGMQELNGLLLRNPYSRPVAQQAMADLAALGGLSGAAFDRAYMDRQVAAHQNALAALDRLLAQNTLGGGMRALLTTLRAAVAAHLQMAQQIRAGL